MAVSGKQVQVFEQLMVQAKTKGIHAARLSKCGTVGDDSRITLYFLRAWLRAWIHVEIRLYRGYICRARLGIRHRPKKNLRQAQTQSFIGKEEERLVFDD